MKAVNLSQVSQTNFTNKQEIKKEIPKAPEQKKNGKKLLAAGADAVATIAIAALAIKNLLKATQVTDLKFNKGIAMKGDELFTGVAEFTNKKGDKFLLEYRDGVLKKSVKNRQNHQKMVQYWANVTQVADLKFNKGIAMKGDELFTGVAEFTNKKGDKFLLEYRDGVLKKSMKNRRNHQGMVR